MSGTRGRAGETAEHTLRHNTLLGFPWRRHKKKVNVNMYAYSPCRLTSNPVVDL